MDYALAALQPNVPILLAPCSNTALDNTQTSRRAHPALASVVARTSRGRGQQTPPRTHRHGVQGDFGPKRRLWLASTSRCAGLKAGRIGRRMRKLAAGFASPTPCDVRCRKMGRPGNTACDSFDAVRPRVHECQDRVTVPTFGWFVRTQLYSDSEVYLLQWNQLLKGWSWLCTQVLTNAINFGVNHPRNVSICPAVLTHKEQLYWFPNSLTV
jgi:hypothetical protein